MACFKFNSAIRLTTAGEFDNFNASINDISVQTCFTTVGASGTGKTTLSSSKPTFEADDHRDLPTNERHVECAKRADANVARIVMGTCPDPVMFISNTDGTEAKYNGVFAACRDNGIQTTLVIVQPNNDVLTNRLRLKYDEPTILRMIDETTHALETEFAAEQDQLGEIEALIASDASVVPAYKKRKLAGAKRLSNDPGFKRQLILLKMLTRHPEILFATLRAQMCRSDEVAAIHFPECR
jgi:hypothetical protein